MSHPVRVRGLKHNKRVALLDNQIVAPRAGAWIETSLSISFGSGYQVAPRAGAWIETGLSLLIRLRIICRTPCGCVD